jgi:hypothetical protein
VREKLEVQPAIAERFELVRALEETRGVLRGRDQAPVENPRLERIAHIQIVRAAADTLEADDARGHARVRPETIERRARRARRADDRTDEAEPRGVRRRDVLRADRVDRDAVRAGSGDRIALRLPGERIDEVERLLGDRVEQHVPVALGPVALGERKLAAIVQFQGSTERPAVA